MCCHACTGFDACQGKTKLRDDCCIQCRYFDSCMETSLEEKDTAKTNPPKKKYVKARKV